MPVPLRRQNTKEPNKRFKNMKKLDLSKNIFELTTLYPELIDIMAELGFVEIKKEFMRKSMGKLMTLPNSEVLVWKRLS